MHSVHHFIIGCVLIIKGYDKISHHYNIIGGLILSFGIIIILYFIYVLLKRKQNKNLDAGVHFFEALVGLFTAYIFFKEGKVYLPYVCLIASIGFFISVYVSLVKKK